VATNLKKIQARSDLKMTKSETLDKAVFYASEAQKEFDKSKSDSVTLNRLMAMSSMYSQLSMAMK